MAEEAQKQSEQAFSDRHEIFITEYIKCLNASEAARRAGYAEANVNVEGSRLLANANIRSEVNRRLRARIMTADELLDRLTQQAHGPGDYIIDVKSGMAFVDWDKIAREGKLHLIKELRYDSNGHPVVKFCDPQRAAELLARYHKLLHDTTSVDVTTTGSLTINIVNDDEDNE